MWITNTGPQIIWHLPFTKYLERNSQAEYNDFDRDKIIICAQPQLLVRGVNIVAALTVGTSVFSHYTNHISNEHSKSNNEIKELIEKT